MSTLRTIGQSYFAIEELRVQHRKVLLLGSTGFLGSSLQRSLQVNPSLDIIAPSRRDLEMSGTNDLAAGILDRVKRYDISAVVNCIASTSLQRCENEPTLTRLINTQLPASLARNLPNDVHLIHFSTDAVFSGSSSPYRPQDEMSPSTAYGQQKAEADNSVGGRQNLSIIRSSFFGTSRGGKPGILNYFLDGLKSGHHVVGFTDYVNNMVSTDVISRVVEKCIRDGAQGLLHIGSKESFSKYDFGCIVADVFGYRRERITPDLSPAGSLAHGGVNLTLECASSWAKLGLQVPDIISQVERLKHST